MPIGREKRFIRAASGFTSTSGLRINNDASMDLLGPATANLSVLFQLSAMPGGFETIIARSNYPALSQGYRIYISGANLLTAELLGGVGSPVIATASRSFLAADINKWICCEVSVDFASATGLIVAVNGVTGGTVGDTTGLTYGPPVGQDLLFGASSAAGDLPGTTIRLAYYQSASGEVPLADITGMFNARYLATRDAMKLHPLASPIVYCDFSRYRGAGVNIADGTVTRGGHFGDTMGGARIEEYLANPCTVADYEADDPTADWVQM